MSLTKAFARRILAISPLIAGAAFLALAAFTPSIAMAGASLTIYHDSAPPSNGADPSVNPFNSSHTVVAQFSGVCAEVADTPDNDGEGSPCLVDSDCNDFLVDEFCDLSGTSGVPVGFHILGTNAQDIDFSTTNGSGQVSTTYSDTNGPGTDTIQACADLGEGSGIDDSVATCLTDSEAEDIPSNTLTKDWVPTVVLSPPGAFNLVGGSHTVTATLNGVVGKCTVTATACTSDAACSGGNTCDFSGFALGIKVTSGPNTGGPGTDNGLVATNSKGQVTMTYSDTLAGTDTIQACSDGDFADANVGACLTDAAAGGGDSPFDDIASNVAQKTWSAVNVALTPLIAFNPIGVPHVVTATSAGISKRCAAAQGFGPCTSDAQCSSVVGSCTFAGYPVFFAVVGTCTGGNNGGATCVGNSNCNSNVCTGGPNLGQQTTGVTDANGATTGKNKN